MISVRAEGQRTGDADALALPAGELVRVAAQPRCRQPDDVEQLADALGVRRPTRRGGCAPAAARPGSTRRSAAGRGWPSGPGRPSAYCRRSGAASSARRADGCHCRRSVTEPGSARSAAGPRGRASSCRSRTRRPVRTSSPASTSRSTPSTALDGADAALEQGPGPDREVDLEVADFEQAHRRHVPVRAGPRLVADRPQEQRTGCGTIGVPSWATGGGPVRHSATARSQRGWKAHPRSHGTVSRGGTGDGVQQVGRSASSMRGIDCSRPSVYGCDGRPNSSFVGRRLDDAAGVHDVDVVAQPGDDAEVVRDHDQPAAALGHQRAQQVQDLRLDGDVERRRRLVGDQQFRPAGDRDGDHDPLAHAAGELVRILAEAADRVGDADPVAAAARPRPSASPLLSPACRASTSVSCRPMVTTGFSDVIGSWKIIATSRPRTSRSSRWSSRRQLVAVQRARCR